jgi:hypothetical protein
MINAMLRRLAVAAALVLAATVPGSTKSSRTNFDGSWSVVIMTDAGTCARAYRYGLRIVGGQLHYDGGMGVALSGQVTPNGSVRVYLRQGDAAAQGSGQLSRSAGAGRWQGASPNLRCSGRWHAERLQ